MEYGEEVLLTRRSVDPARLPEPDGAASGKWKTVLEVVAVLPGDLSVSI